MFAHHAPASPLGEVPAWKLGNNKPETQPPLSTQGLAQSSMAGAMTALLLIVMRASETAITSIISGKTNQTKQRTKFKSREIS